MNTYKKCGKCKRRALKLWKGKYLFCIKHYRFLQMREAAAKRYKYSPSFNELETMLNAILPSFECFYCKEKMVWTKKENTRKVITLQHDDSGKIKFLCASCNCHHQHLGDVLYKLPLNVKKCSSCKKIKELGSFNKGKCWGGRSSRCKNCINAYDRARPEYRALISRRYRAMHHERVMAYQREYRRKNREQKRSIT